MKNTALDALERGFHVTIETDAVRAIDAKPGDAKQAIAEVAAARGKAQ